jgi:pyruvate ferredoxin oxidoreductase alpha subunit
MSRRVVVIDRALELGVGGVLTGDVRHALGADVAVHSVVAGLGGRPITQEVLAQVVRRGVAGELGDLEFCDLKADVLAGLSS